LKSKKLQIVAVTAGEIEVRSGNDSVKLNAGAFCLVPACLGQSEIFAKSNSSLLHVTAN
jgi:hypothetical protein